MLTESMEDYLEMIHRIVEEKGYIKAVDLAEALQLKASSITKMIQKLHETGFILYEKYRHMELTEKGNQYGRFLVWRDETLKEFLMIPSYLDHIEEQVEGMEHYITPRTMSLIYSLILYFKENQEAREELQVIMERAASLSRDGFKELRAWEFKHSL